MAIVIPSRDWPKRTAPLNGQELLLKQNSPLDATSLPKEELVPTQLISDYILTHIDDLTFSGGVLTLHLDGGVNITSDLSSIGEVTDISVNLNGQIIVTKTGGETVEINVSELVLQKSVTGIALSQDLTLTLNRINASDIALSLSALDKTITTAAVVGDNLVLTKADASTVSFNLSPLLNFIKVVTLQVQSNYIIVLRSQNSTNTQNLNIIQASGIIHNCEIIPANVKVTNADIGVNLYQLKFPPVLYGKKLSAIKIYFSDMGTYFEDANIMRLVGSVNGFLNIDTFITGENVYEANFTYNIDSSSYINISLANDGVLEQNMPFGLYFTLYIKNA